MQYNCRVPPFLPPAPFSTFRPVLRLLDLSPSSLCATDCLEHSGFRPLNYWPKKYCWLEIWAAFYADGCSLWSIMAQVIMIKGLQDPRWASCTYKAIRLRKAILTRLWLNLHLLLLPPLFSYHPLWSKAVWIALHDNCLQAREIWRCQTLPQQPKSETDRGSFSLLLVVDQDIVSVTLPCFTHTFKIPE